MNLPSRFVGVEIILLYKWACGKSLYKRSHAKTLWEYMLLIILERDT